MTRNTQLILVIAMLVIGVIAIVGFVLLAPKSASNTATGPQQVAESDLVTPTAHMTGSPKASVTLVEWGDFECPFCAAAAPALEQIAHQYAGNPDFNFVFRNFPLPQHANARDAAEAAEAAGAQGKFWAMYQELYANQDQWVNAPNPRSFFDQYAQAIGIDQKKFDDALDAHTYAQAVQDDYAKAMALGLDHTPSLFLNGKAVGTDQLNDLPAEIAQLLGSTSSSTGAR